MSDAELVSLPKLPAPAHWAVAPLAWAYAAERGLTIESGPRTDMFIDPAGTPSVLNAPRLLFPTEGDVLLQACVHVDFRATFDAGVLLLYASETRWAKLCFEMSPQGSPMIVSVVTRAFSDDANSVVIAGQSVWLRVARLGPATALHWSTDGRSWNLARYFALGGEGPLLAGFSSQSPVGQGCTSRFEQIDYRVGRLRDLRDGS